MADYVYHLAQADPGGVHDGHYTTWAALMAAEGAGWSVADNVHIWFGNDWSAGWLVENNLLVSAFADGVKVTLQGVDPTIRSILRLESLGFAHPGMYVLNRDDVTLKDFDIYAVSKASGGGHAGVYFRVSARSKAIGLHIYGSAGVLDDAIRAYYNPVAIVSCDLGEGCGNGVVVSGSNEGYRVNVDNSVIHGTTVYGLYQDQERPFNLFTVRNTVFYDNPSDVELIGTTPDGPASHNASDNTPVYGTSPYGSTLTSADFVNAAGGDFHLAAGSGLKTAGTDLSGDHGADWRDIDGQAFAPASPAIGFDHVEAAGLSLSPNDLAYTVVADPPALLQGYSLGPAGVAYAYVSAPATLALGATLEPAAAQAPLTMDAPALVQAAGVAPADSHYAGALGSPGLSQALDVSAADMAYALTLATPTLAQHGQLTAAVLHYANRAGEGSLTVIGALAPAALQLGLSFDQAALMQAAQITPIDTGYDFAIEAPALVMNLVMAPSDASYNVAFEAPALIGGDRLNPQALTYPYQLDSAALATHRVLAVADRFYAYRIGAAAALPPGLDIPSGTIHLVPRRITVHRLN